MNCLHLCNDYLGSQVHTNLYKNLEEYGVTQTVFVPLRKEKVDKYQSGTFYQSERTRIVFSNILKPYHKVFFGAKIKGLYRSLISQLDVAGFDVVCASTLYSDGSLAFKIFEQYKTPYIVAVRSVDVDVFMRFRPDLHGLMRNILDHAKAIVFISEGLSKKFFERVGAAGRERWFHKASVIHNGIDEYWLSNRPNIRGNNPGKFLYVGSLIKRKNVGRVIKAIVNLNRGGNVEAKLGIVGDGGYFSKFVRRCAAKYPAYITYYGSVMDKSKLREIYNKYDVFIMPSYRETFGLVYVEALTQGLTLIISEGEGVDGMFDQASIKVNPFSVASIESAIRTAGKEHNQECTKQIELNHFSWARIAGLYVNLLKSNADVT